MTTIYQVKCILKLTLLKAGIYKTWAFLGVLILLSIVRVAPQIKIGAQRSNGHWVFAIADNGIGIEEQHKERIFIFFQRLHTLNEYDGSSIGLAHCKKIVELHGGKIWVESMPGEGATFHFTLPAGQVFPENNNL